MAETVFGTKTGGFNVYKQGQGTYQITGTINKQTFYPIVTVDIASLGIDRVSGLYYFRGSSALEGGDYMLLAKDYFLVQGSTATWSLQAGFQFTNTSIQFGYYGLAGSADINIVTASPFVTLTYKYYVLSD